MNLKYLIVFLLVFSIESPLMAQENFNSNHFHFFFGSPIPEKTGFEKFLERFYIGISYPLASIDVKEHYSQYVGTRILDTTVSKSVSSAPSFGGFIGFFVPLAYIGENSGCLAINAEIMGTYTTWDVKAVNFTNGAIGAHDDATATSIAVGLPLSIDYKYGADGILDKYKRFMLTLGVGGTPTAYTNTYVKSGTSFAFIPFIKGEIGFFAGVGMKLRGTIGFGT